MAKAMHIRHTEFIHPFAILVVLHSVLPLAGACFHAFALLLCVAVYGSRYRSVELVETLLLGTR